MPYYESWFLTGDDSKVDLLFYKLIKTAEIAENL